MLSPQLISFLQNLNMDPGLLAAFEADRESVLASTSLEPDEKAIMAKPEAYRLLQSMAGDDLPLPGGAPAPTVG